MAKRMIVLVFAAAVLVLAGCAVEDKYGPEIIRKEFHPDIVTGRYVAEIWVKSPDEKATLLGNTAQDVVSIEHGTGQMALPDQIKGDLPTQAAAGASTFGFIPISVYHLVRDDKEVGYYKRRFSRAGNTKPGG